MRREQVKELHCITSLTNVLSSLFVPPETPPTQRTHKFLLEAGEAEEIGHAQLVLLEHTARYQALDRS